MCICNNTIAYTVKSQLLYEHGSLLALFLSVLSNFCASIDVSCDFIFTYDSFCHSTFMVSAHIFCSSFYLLLFILTTAVDLNSLSCRDCSLHRQCTAGKISLSST